MRTAGLIGGIGPESTIEYYRLLIAEYRARTSDDSYPPLLINSIDVTRMLRFVAAGELVAVAEDLPGEVRKLAGAGADFAAFASNTPHIVFDEVQRRSPLPLLSIVEATCASARRYPLHDGRGASIRQCSREAASTSSSPSRTSAATSTRST